ncbi:ATP-dependent DNA ligase [Methyloceanibacter sp.]|uniref:ATP-dependent DNA ligase n=1 Tax=Methyloceanibacter sp. TaxID=1965321 RepID=UPI003D6DA46A
MKPPKTLSALAVPLDIEPMEAKLVEELPEGGWQYEPKWDGFRCLAFRAGGDVDLKAKSGKPLARYFPEMVATLARLPQTCFVLDGELAIVTDGEFSFDALLQRIHPAESRIKLLATETPAIFILFDMLLDASGKSLIEAPLTERRAALETFFASAKQQHALKLSPYTLSLAEAGRWLKQGGTALDGVVAKERDGPYVPGERAMMKVKQRRTADCVVGGFRYRTASQEVGSLLLGLYDADGKLDHVGFTATIANKDRAALTAKLEALVSPPGFTGKAPGGPSRWSTERSEQWQPLKPKLVVEVAFDHVTGNRFRHGTKLVRFRPDKRPSQCSFEQIALPAKPSKLVSAMLKS